MLTIPRQLSAVATASALALAVAAAAGANAGAASVPGTDPGAGTAVSSTWPVTECGTYSGTGCAPTADRVDLTKPVFSNPTTITNPLFPISKLRSVVQLGTVDGKPFRSEVTLLPSTGTVSWEGKKIQVLLIQYLAYLDGRIEEIALDRYAQADDGSVWYLGEDVYDYREGSIVVTEGTWLTGRDGPPAMIMPAKPKVGDVFRAENVTGVVFEEVEVTAVDQTVPGPNGPVRGAMVGRELHLDGTYSDKVFAPGYGEFRSASDGSVEAMAIAVPTDAASGPMPAPLPGLTTAAWGILENVRLTDWQAADATIKRMNAGWQALTAIRPAKPIATRMETSLKALTTAVAGRKAAPAAQAAVDVAQSTLDLQLRYRPAVEVDRERIHLHTQQLRVHAARKDAAGVVGEVAVLEWFRDRLAGSGGPSVPGDLDDRLGDLRVAVDAGNLTAAADHAARIGARVRGLG